MKFEHTHDAYTDPSGVVRCEEHPCDKPAKKRTIFWGGDYNKDVRKVKYFCEPHWQQAFGVGQEKHSEKGVEK